MGQLMSFSFLCLLMYLLTSCGSEVPIAPVNNAIEDDRLVGIWLAKDSTNHEMIEGVVYKFNEKEYFVELREEKIDSGEIKRDSLHIRAYIIEIKNKRFINAQIINSVEKNERAYFFYAYSFIEPDKLKLITLNDINEVRINSFADSPSLYNFIEQNIDNKQLYGEPFKFIKQK